LEPSRNIIRYALQALANLTSNDKFLTKYVKMHSLPSPYKNFVKDLLILLPNNNFQSCVLHIINN
jgi:hypothetical protein